MENPYSAIEAKASRTFMRVCFLFESQRLRTDIGLNVYRALVRSVLTHVCPAWEFCGRRCGFETAGTAKQGLPNNARFARTWIRSQNYNQQAQVVQNHENDNVRNTGQGEAQQRTYKRLKPASDLSSD